MSGCDIEKTGFGAIIVSGTGRDCQERTESATRMLATIHFSFAAMNTMLGSTDGIKRFECCFKVDYVLLARWRG